MMKKKPIKVAVTGAAGQIGYSLLFRLASGEVFGGDQPVHLNLIELPAAVDGAEGSAMELEDCAYGTLSGISIYDNPTEGFADANWVLLVGSKPRGPGMKRFDLIRDNGPIFVEQGKALNRAASDVRVVVVGNPCNTNCLIVKQNSRDIPSNRFTAMTRLDENRAKFQLAKKAGISVENIENMIIWGNHSTTMYPDFENAIIGKKPALDVIGDRGWLENIFISEVQGRGTAIIDVRGKSSAASGASAIIDHIKSLLYKTKESTFFSAAVPSDGRFYGVPAGIVFSFPLKSDGYGGYEIVRDLKISDFAKERIRITASELLKEREIVKDLLG